MYRGRDFSFSKRIKKSQAQEKKKSRIQPHMGDRDGANGSGKRENREGKKKG